MSKDEIFLEILSKMQKRIEILEMQVDSARNHADFWREMHQKALFEYTKLVRRCEKKAENIKDTKEFFNH